MSNQILFHDFLYFIKFGCKINYILTKNGNKKI